MADPFEVRLRFTNLLTHLTASTTSSLKTASFALKHRDMDEDLHSCILESLDASSTSLNARANIMYFLEHFCDMAGRSGAEGHAGYVEMVRRDIVRIVGGVVGREGGANVKVVRRVVEALRGKGVLGEEGVRGVEEELKRRSGGGGAGVEREDEQKREERREEKRGRKEGKSNGHHGGRGVDKRAIEQRIEEDRERNKRLRESVWAVGGEDEDELDKLWEETSDLCEDDYAIAREEAEERAQFARYHRSLLLEAGK